MFASITSLGATGTGVTGIFGILLCLNTPVKYILMFLIAAGVAFVLTWIFGYENKKEDDKKVEKDTLKETTALSCLRFPNIEETFLLSPCITPHTVILNFVNLLSYFITTIIQSQYLHF